MTEQVLIGGRLRPVRFGFAGLYEYEKRTGRRALADFAELSQGLEQVSVELIVQLVYSGLTAGYRHDKQNVDFDEYDVADWITEDTGVIEKVMTVFANSFPTEGNGQTGKPKTKATPAA